MTHEVRPNPIATLARAPAPADSKSPRGLLNRQATLVLIAAIALLAIALGSPTSVAANVTTYGGEVESSPHVYEIFWGSNWNSEPAAAWRVKFETMFQDISESAWQGILTQYWGPNGFVSHKLTVGSPYTDTEHDGAAPAGVDESKIKNEIALAIEANKNNGWPQTPTVNDQFVVLTPPGTTYSSSTVRELCGFHRWGAHGGGYFAFAYVAWTRKISGKEEEVCFHHTAVASHEYAEAVTDPFLDAWGHGTQDEIADDCAELGAFPGGIEVSGLWDNSSKGPFGLSEGYCETEDSSPPQIAPAPSAEAPSNVTLEGATLRGAISPNGLVIESYRFEWGATEQYGHSTTAEIWNHGQTETEVKAVVGGLSPNTPYHYRLRVEGPANWNSPESGHHNRFYGGDKTFTTLAKVPEATTQSASSIKATEATLNASINPSGVSTTYHFEYGKTTSYGTSVPVPSESVGSGTEAVAKAKTITGLSPETAYHYRVVAENSEGTAYGKDQEFTALAVTPSHLYYLGKGHGAENGQFEWPKGIAVDQSGDVWVSDYTLNRVQEFTESGEYLRQFGSAGSGNGQFIHPNGITITASGNLWVVDAGNHRIQEFNSKGEYLAQFGTSGTGNGQFSSPTDITIAPDGSIWVTDKGNDNVQRFTASGDFLLKTGSKGTENGQFTDPNGIAAEADGSIWVVDEGNDRMQKLSSSGSFLTKFGSKGSGAGQFEEPTDVVVKPSGNLFVADGYPNHRVQELSQAGQQLASIYEWIPEEIALGRGGRFFIPQGSSRLINVWSQPAAPEATTQSASSIKATEATLNASINPSGVSTTYHFEYGKTTSYGTSVPVPSESVGSGTEAVAKAKTITGLSPETTYHYRVVAENSEGTAYGKDTSFATLPNPPANTSLPVVASKTALQAIAETATKGTWTNKPTSYSYQWRRCNSAGVECVDISSATASTYTPVEADVEHTLRVVVTATNSGGSGKATSEATLKVPPLGQITEYALSGGEAIGIATGSDGNLWFSDGRIGKITPVGTVTEYSLPGGNYCYSKVAKGPDGNIWFTVSSTNKVGKITTSGMVTEYSVPAGSYPSGITVGPDGNMWFGDSGTGKISKITTSGAITEYALATGNHPTTLATGSDGRLWFGEYVNKFGKITTTGAITEYSLPSESYINDITSGPDGNLWVTEERWNESMITKITTSGTTTEYHLPEMSYPYGITSGADGRLWFTNWGTSTIGRITTSGAISEFPLPTNSHPNFIASGPENYLWFTDGFTQKIGKIAP